MLQGYLALTLLMHENSDLVRLVINSIRKDLDDNNEINNCLALHAIATLGGKEMAEALSDNVYRAMVSQYVAPLLHRGPRAERCIANKAEAQPHSFAKKPP